MIGFKSAAAYVILGGCVNNTTAIPLCNRMSIAKKINKAAKPERIYLFARILFIFIDE